MMIHLSFLPPSLSQGNPKIHYYQDNISTQGRGKKVGEGEDSSQSSHMTSSAVKPLDPKLAARRGLETSEKRRNFCMGGGGEVGAGC